MTKILHISDTHSYHTLLTIPEDIDIIIHSGDFSNYYNLVYNTPEAIDFIQWYGSLEIKYKVLVAGNHDAYAFHNGKELRELCIKYGIIYLENESVTIEGLKIYGSPVTPQFGNWYFMKARHKMDEFWKNIPDDTDILVVHGPPKGILDLATRADNNIEQCGCKSLFNHCMKRLNLRLCLFGHIHNNDGMMNAGITKLANKDTIFSNGSVVTDRLFGILTSEGNIFEL